MDTRNQEALFVQFRSGVLQLAAELGRLERHTDQETGSFTLSGKECEGTYCVLVTSGLTVDEVERHILAGIRSDAQLTAAALELMHRGAARAVTFELRGEVWRGSYDFSFAHMMSITPASVFPEGIQAL